MDSYILFETATLDRRDILQSLGIVSEFRGDRSWVVLSAMIYQVTQLSECRDGSRYLTFSEP